jgi:hypothetical protein
MYSVFPKDIIGLRNKQIECDHNSELSPEVRTAYILSVLIEDWQCYLSEVGISCKMHIMF